MEQITLDLFSFEELSNEAQQVAIEAVRNSEYYLSHDWYDSTKEDFHQILNIIGFYDVKSQFSGFNSQGDGASFSANYRYQTECLTNVKIHAPNDNELHDIVSGIVKIMRRYFYRLECEIYTQGYYCHSNTMSFNWSYNDRYDCNISDEDESILNQLFRDLADWYYEKLNKEYDYLMSDEGITGHIAANKCKYTVDGKEFLL
ncbi:hypothetical protein BJD49_gp044 [Acinetobacter phage vB_AbaM_phiAbaA1]|uniref:hypothetical protein n=1 Tax=Acinetobacter phage vB_AbaM_phiAbaA1 TaxID=1605379 RepID=UPI00078BF9A3|nr:hypothetical protein BJD49_gp044 [Acinetobacter phage vB_AbaM_phiAbaA1]AJK27246.1 hypothetical protein phiAbaA1_143 [Acinetobacter phage vB_AbaM_phiAbaA1]